MGAVSPGLTNEGLKLHYPMSQHYLHKAILRGAVGADEVRGSRLEISVHSGEQCRATLISWEIQGNTWEAKEI